ncbi:membrane protein FxsA [Bacillus canaveralius]|uniref:Membrane protein FxsA n=1 Tax=Bacillus canaveralius TaxID=1403243 RepID=A0A2N5GJN2_9BACI|nr:MULTISPECIES: FxsA family protein [Bacillus]PLR81483.1 membrane protein FxsA [Bacillus canaveralius]PLR82342.1 membrane protein FxsA [Bacillus sp. V33-4]PLR93867.1 membrane protein FxsA [Bacillus canaveralius]RSK52749.1 membrane protein FxsA [Bacillus canaveralius]
MRFILLLVIIIPAAEIAVLMLSGQILGVWPTIFLILFTGVLGAYLAKKQGLQTIRRIQEQLRYGQLPGDALLDGGCVLIGGTLLLTPGFITDVAGLLLLAPPTRKVLKIYLLKAFKKWIDKGHVTIIR